MGYIRNECMVITGSLGPIRRAHQECIKIFNSIETPFAVPPLNTLISEVMSSLVNNAGTFMIGVDGSKEGWKESDCAEKGREEFIKWLNEEDEFYEWALIILGGDDGIYEVTNYPGKKED